MGRIYFTAAPPICEDAGGDSLLGNSCAYPSIGSMGGLSAPEQPQNTGLLDHRGNTIFSAEQREPIGFRMHPHA